MNAAEVVFIPAGNVEYSLEEASTPIEELIDNLVDLQEQGATHVAGWSGNYRGAQYVRLGMPELGEDDE